MSGSVETSNRIMRVHMRDSSVRTMSVCGLGDGYVLTAPLTDDKQEVTCKNCLRLLAMP